MSEQLLQDVEALRQMAVPLMVVCTILREGGETQQYELADAWVDFIQGRTVIFEARIMTQGGA